MPLYWNEKTLLVKTEVTYGTDAVPTGAANALLATEVRIMPMEGQDVDRALELPYMGASGTVAAELHTKISFKIEAKGSGVAGTPPAYAPILKACAMAEVTTPGTSVTYSRVSRGQDSATIYLNVDGTLYALRGARGTATLRLSAQGILYYEVEMTGLWVMPAAQIKPATTLGNQLTAFPKIASSENTPVFTIAGANHVLRSLSLNFGNSVVGRFLIGSESIIIEDIEETVEMQIEAVPLATLNPFALAKDGTLSEIILQHGTVAGDRLTLTMPRCQFLRPSGLENQQGIVEWPLRAKPLPNAGNDQLTIVYT